MNTAKTPRRVLMCCFIGPTFSTAGGEDQGHERGRVYARRTRPVRSAAERKPQQRRDPSTRPSEGLPWRSQRRDLGVPVIVPSETCRGATSPTAAHPQAIIVVSSS